MRDCALAVFFTTSTGTSTTSQCTSEEEGLHSGLPSHNVGEYFGGEGTGSSPRNVGVYLGGGGTGPALHNVGEYFRGEGTGASPHNVGVYLGGGGTGPPPRNDVGVYLGGGGTGPPTHNSGEYVSTALCLAMRMVRSGLFHLLDLCRRGRSVDLNSR